MTWDQGHPPHWCTEIESLGYNRPPDNHKFEKGACVFCGHPEASATEPRPDVGGACVE